MLWSLIKGLFRVVAWVILAPFKVIIFILKVIVTVILSVIYFFIAHPVLALGLVFFGIPLFGAITGRI